MAIRDKSNEVRGKERSNKSASDLLTFLLSYLLFFVLCFVYLWLVVEPHLIYYAFGTILPDAPLFATGWSFLRDALGAPGGLVTYVSGFLSLGYRYAWLGAAIIVLAGLCLSELSRRHFVLAGFPRASILASLPAIALFLIYNRYKHPLTICLAVSLGLLLSLIFERLPSRRPLVRAVACCLIAVTGFWLGGGGTLLVFALMTVIYAVPGRVCTAHRLPSDERTAGARGTPYELLALPASVAIAWALSEYVFLLPVRQALLTLTPFSPSLTAGTDTVLQVLIFLLYGLPPAAMLLLLLAEKGTFYFSARKPARGAGKREKSRMSPFLGKAALVVLPVALMALGLYFGHDELRKPYALSNYYWRQRQWEKIIELSRRLPKNRNNVYVNHDTIRALYHTGRLPYDLFRFPLIPEAILLTHEKGQSDLTQVKLCDIWLELGYVNVAEKLASEVLTTKGQLGLALDALGRISIIKGHPATARIYLNALKKDPVHRHRAKSLLHGLDSGFTPDQAASIDRIRACMLDDTMAITGTEPVDETLAALLRHNPHNRMAFEYLMACYLLTGRVDKIVENVQRLPALGYPKIPTLYEEAICIHYGTTGQQVDLDALRISPQTVQRYEAFVRAMGAMQTQNRQAVLNHLIREFGASYFFYFAFGKVGAS